jgi:hypothetical protein
MQYSIDLRDEPSITIRQPETKASDSRRVTDLWAHLQMARLTPASYALSSLPDEERDSALRDGETTIIASRQATAVVASPRKNRSENEPFLDRLRRGGFDLC